MRLIIVEGPTGAGKSTLIERLQKTYALPVIHTGAPPSRLKDPKVVEEWYADRLNARTSDGLILDRWLPSNQVYGRVLKNQPVLPRSAVDRLERIVLDARWICGTIFLSATPELLLRRIRRRTKSTWDRLRSPETLAALVKGYDQQFNLCNLPKIQLTTVDAPATYREAHAYLETLTQ